MMPAHGELVRDFLAAPAAAPVTALADYQRRTPRPAASITIGVFDGVHAGHRELIARTVADARARGALACAVTFDPDPDEVLSSHPARRLMDPADRLAALAATGVDLVLVVPFTRELAALDHARFFEDVLGPVLDVRAVHVGSDFRLGAGGVSTVPVIRDWAAARGIEVTGHELVLDDGLPVSATRIRARLAAGDLAGARAELGRRYLVRGLVEAGRGQGTGMGFPTANIRVDARLQMPADGVYAGLALVDGWVWPAAVNVGVPPTYRDVPGAGALEANLIGFTGNIYGTKVSLAFDRFLRPSATFDSTEELISTVLGDIDRIRTALGEEGVRLA